MATTATSNPTLEDRFLGSILGLAIGDAICAPYEALPATAIWYDFGGAQKIIREPTEPVLNYTDDTEMTIGVIETLIACGSIDEDELAMRFAANFNSGRGYGPGARRIVESMIASADWREVAKRIYAGGSFGNGAAMRVAPVGLLFHHDLDRVEAEAERSARVTHLHPLGIDGARVLALAVAMLVRSSTFDAKTFYASLIHRAKTDEFRYRLGVASRLSPSDTVASLGNGIEAHHSVVTAIACFTMTPDSYEATIASALCLGGDVDTIAAMAGALSGAFLGHAALPKHLLERLENGVRGRDDLETLASRLSERYLGGGFTR